MSTEYQRMTALVNQLELSALKAQQAKETKKATRPTTPSTIRAATATMSPSTTGSWARAMTDGKVLADLTALLGADVVLAPSDTLLDKHTKDFCVTGRPDVGVMALVFVRDTAQVAKTLAYCQRAWHRRAAAGRLTGLAGGAVPVGPCVILSLERMRAIKELDTVAGTITVEAGVTMETVQKAADAAELFFPAGPRRPRLLPDRRQTSPPMPAAIACCAMAWRVTWCWAWKPCSPMAR